MYHTYAHTVLMKRINVNNVVTNFNSHITLVMRIKYFACISKESVFILYRFVTLILLIYHIYIYNLHSAYYRLFSKIIFRHHDRQRNAGPSQKKTLPNFCPEPFTQIDTRDTKPICLCSHSPFTDCVPIHPSPTAFWYTRKLWSAKELFLAAMPYFLWVFYTDRDTSATKTTLSTTLRRYTTLCRTASHYLISLPHCVTLPNLSATLRHTIYSVTLRNTTYYSFCHTTPHYLLSATLRHTTYSLPHCATLSTRPHRATLPALCHTTLQHLSQQRVWPDVV